VRDKYLFPEGVSSPHESRTSTDRLFCVVQYPGQYSAARKLFFHLMSTNPKIKRRTIAIGAFCSGLVGGTAGGFKEWATNISPDYSGFLGALLAALIGALIFSVLERRYVQPIVDRQNA